MIWHKIYAATKGISCAAFGICLAAAKIISQASIASRVLIFIIHLFFTLQFKTDACINIEAGRIKTIYFREFGTGNIFGISK